jgi:hypothetical protein
VRENAKKKNRVLTASEIGQYTFCSLSWHLQQQGYTPDPHVFEQGTKAHEHLGKQVYFYQHTKKKSTHLFIAGCILLGIAVLLLLGGVLFT